MKWLKTILVILILILIVYVVWFFMSSRPAANYKNRAARIKSIEQMVDLCTLDIHEEISIRDSIHGKWIVAKQTLEGRVRFDLDSLRIEERGDTTFVYLPPSKVEVLEGATPESYEVIDSWDGSRRVFGRVLTASEENVLKRRWANQSVRRIYEKGYVRKARQSAVATLTPLFRQLQGPFGKQGPVIVVDDLTDEKYPG